MLGYLQTQPNGSPASVSALHTLVASQDTIGGPTDTWLNVANSGLAFCARRIEVGVANDGSGPVFVATVRGVPKLPTTGAWSVVRRAVAGVPLEEREAVPVEESRGVPLIRRYPVKYPADDASPFSEPPLDGLPSAAGPYRFADAADLFELADPAHEYAILQSTPTHAFIFPRPYMSGPGATRIETDGTPVLADIVARSTSKAAFPPPPNAIELPGGLWLETAPAGTLALSAPIHIVGHPTPLRLAGSDGHGSKLLYDDATLKLTVEHDRWEAEFDGLKLYNDIAGMNRLTGSRLHVVGSTSQRSQIAEIESLVLPEIEKILQFIPIFGQRGVHGPIDLGATNAKHEFKLEAKLEVDVPRTTIPIVSGADVKLKLSMLASTGFDKNTGEVTTTGKFGIALDGDIPVYSVAVVTVYVKVSAGIDFTITSASGMVKSETLGLTAFAGVGVKGTVGPFKAYAYLGVGFILSYDITNDLAKYGGLVAFEAGIEIIEIIKVKLRAELKGLVYDNAGETQCDYTGSVKLQVEIFFIFSINIGYRVDVREMGSTQWTSLSRVDAPLSLAVDLGRAVEERWSEVVPTEHQGQIWLPAWFVTWRGGSLVVDTNEEQRLMQVPPGRPVPETPLDADAVPLRYGRRYEFRVRLADTTGGGPTVDAQPVQPGESPIGLLHFKRRRRPGRVQLDPISIAAHGHVASVRLYRPTLGYPEAVFAAGDAARATLLSQIAANDADPPNARAPGVRDPDTQYLRVRVLVRAPTFDPAADATGYIAWYETSRSFPSDPEAPLDLSLSWIDTADLDDVDLSSQAGAEGTVTGPVFAPTARDVRLEVFAAGREDLGYFADDGSRLGTSVSIDLHVVAASAAEADVLARLPSSDALRSVFLRPDPISARAEPRPVVAQNDPTPALLGRLATTVNLVADGSLLVGQPGERIAFGCAGLSHHLAPDSTSLELAEPGELAHQWINVVQTVVDRDWTWRGSGSPTARVIRTVSLPALPAVAPVVTEVGTIELMPTVNTQARHNPERAYSRLVFLDAMAPCKGPDGLPYEVAVSYRIELMLEDGGRVERRIDTLLPIVTPPTQVPRVVAAGIALTPYTHDAEYDKTGSRTKRLWLEFEEPLADPRDAYFVRPLARSPDPMLLPNVEPLADPEVVETIPIETELVRVVTPGQVQDLAGLAAMQRLEPAANSDRRFLVPLPPNTDPNSPELFSFFTYEIRVGHDRGPLADPLWTTAQGRFGEALVLEGVHHPPPELACSAMVEAHGSVSLRAPYATPYVGLRSVRSSNPNTEIWFVLYARVMQADAESRRNVQIDLRRASLVRSKERSVLHAPQAGATWTRAEIEAALDTVGLPRRTPISVLAVELSPEPNGSFSDPLGGDLGQVRILRVSSLAAVVRSCCNP